MINQIDIAVGAKLRQMRTAASIGSARLATQCGIACHLYEAGERGERRFPATELHRLAKALDMPFSTFFTDCQFALMPSSQTIRLHSA